MKISFAALLVGVVTIGQVSAEPIPPANLCAKVSSIVDGLKGFSAVATAYCSIQLKLTLTTVTQTSTKTALTTVVVSTTATGSTTTVTPAATTVTQTASNTVQVTATSTVSVSTTAIQTEPSTITSTATYTAVAQGTVPAYLTPAPKEKRELTFLRFLKKYEAKVISSACSCLDIPTATTVSATATATQTVQQATTIPGTLVTVTAAVPTITTTVTQTVTNAVTTIVTETGTVTSTTTSVATVSVTSSKTINQLPSAVCKNLALAHVDLGVNDSPPGTSASNNFGPYTAESCCLLCYSKPGCYFAYIVVEDPQPGRTPDNNCFLEFFEGTTNPANVCPNQYAVTSPGKRTFPSANYLIPGPCAIVD